MLENFQPVDLTHTICSDMPSWSGRCGFKHEILMDYDQGVRVQKFRMNSGAGTHMDAPAHFFKEGKRAADIPLEDLILPLFVIDLSKKRREDLQLTPKDILEFEKSYQQIPPKSLVIFRSGWEEYWKEPEKYRNEKDNLMLFPSYAKESAELLLERKVSAIGIDTFSPDTPHTDFPVHKLILGNGGYILENLCNLQNLPPFGAFSISLPMKIEEGAEAATRVIALIPKKENL